MGIALGRVGEKVQSQSHPKALVVNANQLKPKSKEALPI
jgi:hypothetical protein